MRPGIYRKAWIGTLLVLTCSLVMSEGGRAQAASAFGTTASAESAQTIPGVPWPVFTAKSETDAHMLVVCVQFAGQKAIKPLSVYRQIYFGKTGSVADYYRQVSFGQFQLSGVVVGDPMHPSQYLQLPHTEAYYAGKDNGTGSPYPHDDDQLVADVIYQLIADHFNFIPYETDGQLPYLAIVYSGYGADVEPGDANLIWPVEDSFNAPVAVPLPGGTATKEKDLMITNYDLVPELDMTDEAPTIGVFAHELGHLLGLDDLYDTSGAVNAGEGDGPWSLMATGNWNGYPQGAQPAELDPWSRILLGWINPIVIRESVTGLRVPPIEQEPVVYELAPVGGGALPWDVQPSSGTGAKRRSTTSKATSSQAPNDFFLIDNVQSLSFDRGLPESGVMIWHIDGREALPGSYDYLNNVLNAPSQNKTHHYDEQVIEAGGTNVLQEPSSDVGVLDDTYPSSAGNDRFTGSSHPSNRLWDGQSVGISLSHIAVGKDGTATMDVLDDQTGRALTIMRPETGLVVTEGTRVPLVAREWNGQHWLDVTDTVTWRSGSQGEGVYLLGNEMTCKRPGFVTIEAKDGSLTALLVVQVIA
ncbi:MAG: M6 family metalloprotease domain-containing protein [Firmicutes bacterium]|nr:M6 family metalloprotease domain-containing protein [Bacillota bacterium]